jgi:hypothetical protein
MRTEDNNNPKEIEELTFNQIKRLTKKSGNFILSKYK